MSTQPMLDVPSVDSPSIFFEGIVVDTGESSESSVDALDLLLVHPFTAV